MVERAKYGFTYRMCSATPATYVQLFFCAYLWTGNELYSFFLTKKGLSHRVCFVKLMTDSITNIKQGERLRGCNSDMANMIRLNKVRDCMWTRKLTGLINLPVYICIYHLPAYIVEVDYNSWSYTLTQNAQNMIMFSQNI